MPLLTVFLIKDNPLADKLLNGISLHQLALDEANSFCAEINKSDHDGAEVIVLTDANQLLGKIKESNCQIAVIHDSLRPLVSAAQFKRAYSALADFDAVRPTMSFTETIKALDGDGRLAETIDREKVRRLSSPEVIKVNAIDFVGAKGSWSVPLKTNAKTSQIPADPEAIRINSDAELELITAFLSIRSVASN